jgi:hypothetical protein
VIERPAPTRIPGPGVPRGQRDRPADAALGILVVLGFAAVAALIGLQVEAWFR